MKNAVAKKQLAAKKKAAPVKKGKVVTKAAAAPKAKALPLETQPQSKQKAATQAGVFLHTDDQWAAAYFNSGDLHCEERELFG